MGTRVKIKKLKPGIKEPINELAGLIMGEKGR
jgi:hypothetical protein